jgi:hypothetical protein
MRQRARPAGIDQAAHRKGVLWMCPAKVSQPALSNRSLTFLAELFQQVIHSLLPKLRECFLPTHAVLERSSPWCYLVFLSDQSSLASLGHLAVFCTPNDLSDASSEELTLPADHIPLEMVFLGFYRFTQAHHWGESIGPSQAFICNRKPRPGCGQLAL